MASITSGNIGNTIKACTVPNTNIPVIIKNKLLPGKPNYSLGPTSKQAIADINKHIINCNLRGVFLKIIGNTMQATKLGPVATNK